MKTIKRFMMTSPKIKTFDNYLQYCKEIELIERHQSESDQPLDEALSNATRESLFIAGIKGLPTFEQYLEVTAKQVEVANEQQPE